MKISALQQLTSRQHEFVSIFSRSRFYSVFMAVFIPALFYVCPDTAFSIELKIRAAAPVPRVSTVTERPGQLPQSRVAKGGRNIIAAWLAGPTNRYQHGVLGDELEASRLVVETTDGNRLHIDLPFHRVFEDLEPRLADVTGDGSDDIIVVESDVRSGASLAVYGIAAGRLVRKAATPFLGRPNRWLNPVGVGDFDGDGQPDIALVATPHIGGILRLYRLNGAHFSLFAEYSGVSTHRIGSTELGLGRVISAQPRDRLLVPDQTRRSIMLLEWTPGGLQEIARVDIPGFLGSALMPMKEGQWRFHLENGKYYDLFLAP